MKISKNSWHYKLLRFIDIIPRKSICEYFWQVVFAMLLIAVALILAIVLCYVMLSPLLMLVSWAPPEMGIGAGFLYLVFIIFYVLKRTFSLISNTSFASVTIEYIYARKKKICPQIDFV